ncbi:hypothetical protein GCM10009097_36690 [Pigmentiphaga daeguensis]|uniref:Uncharacterized protein n=1 Tax=Pigmentiphaga daeguensis TaxID=414049 RepID=A0ABP3MCG2_9BURK
MVYADISANSAEEATLSRTPVEVLTGEGGAVIGMDRAQAGDAAWWGVQASENNYNLQYEGLPLICRPSNSGLELQSCRVWR